MRNIIKYFYNIDFDEIIEMDKYYLFDDYIFIEINKVNMDLYNYLLQNNIYLDNLLPNIKNSYITNYKDKNYMLFKLYSKKEINLDTILNYLYPIDMPNKINWAQRWENKVDYYEQEIINTNNKQLLRIYPYYIGLSECAIRFFKEINIEGSKSLGHYRLDDGNLFFNITNLVVDYKVRDIAEYIKKEFFINDNRNYQFIFNLGLTDIDYGLLFCRLLYPSYFYDCIENNSNLHIYVSKINLFEEYLNTIYNNLRKYVYLPTIKWLIKKA